MAITHGKGKKMSSKTSRQQPHGRPVPSARASRRPLILAGGALLVILFGALLLQRSGTRPEVRRTPTLVAGQPRLVVDRETIDFGNVPINRPVRAVFRLSNAGDKPLRITGEPLVEVRAGC